MKLKMNFAFWFVITVNFALPSGQAEPAADAQIQHGKYLVERVGMCADCHSPRDQKGEFIRSKWLQGSTLAFQPVHPMPFDPVAPGIAGLPMFTTDAQAVTFFETGTNNLGKLALPPMPQVRFNHEDAVAVTAYLRSLKK